MENSTKLCKAQFECGIFLGDLFTMTVIVKKKIGIEIVGTKGALLHDDWTHSSTNYFS